MTTHQKSNVLSHQLINAMLMSKIAPTSYAMKEITLPKANIVLRRTVMTIKQRSNVLSHQLINVTGIFLIAPGSCAKKEIT